MQASIVRGGLLQNVESKESNTLNYITINILYKLFLLKICFFNLQPSYIQGVLLLVNVILFIFCLNDKKKKEGVGR